MSCSTKVGIAAPSGVAMVFGFIVLILGIVVMTSSIPTTSCGPTGTDIRVTATDQDAVDTALMYMTWPLILGGLLAIIGGGVGIFSGLKANKWAICCTGGVLGTAAGFIVVGSLAAMAFAAIFGEMCTEYKCDSTDTCTFGGFASQISPCKSPDVCCKGCTAICMEVNDWACELGSKKTVAMLFGYLGFVVTLVAGCCSCSAGCCCPDKFNEMAAQQSGGGAPAVIGQPVYDTQGK